MKAFVEVLSGVVRAGPDTDCYGAPYEYAVAFSSIDGKTAVGKALTSKGELSVTHVRAAVAEVKKFGLDLTWERMP